MEGNTVGEDIGLSFISHVRPFKKKLGGGKLFVVKEEEHTQAYGGFCGGREWKGRAKGPQGQLILKLAMRNDQAPYNHCRW